MLVAAGLAFLATIRSCPDSCHSPIFELGGVFSRAEISATLRSQRHVRSMYYPPLVRIGAAHSCEIPTSAKSKFHGFAAQTEYLPNMRDLERSRRMASGNACGETVGSALETPSQIEQGSET